MSAKQRVITLMSGGVDSSVAAALLQKQGYEVIGVYILGWVGTADFPCSWQQEENDAYQVAQRLGIPFYSLNVEEAYRALVVKQFLRQYQAGLTPNPDILCNREIKFRVVWEAVRQFEPDFLATGHYARLQPALATSPSSVPRLCQAKDRAKDQTYFLWGIERRLLRRLLFPIGHYSKPQVRKLARQLDLPTANKKDSQGICFIGPLKARLFLQEYLRLQPGITLTVDGRTIAFHQGVQLYTIGQRLGAGSVKWTGDVPPLYVLAKDNQRNRLIVGPDHQTFATQFVATNINWLVEPRRKPFVARAKIRYRQENVPAWITPTRERWKVSFTQPVRAITPGQSLVIYDDRGTLLGGAVIDWVPDQEALIDRVNALV